MQPQPPAPPSRPTAQPAYFQPPMTVPPMPPKKKGWWSRNMAWFIPVLVLGVLGACGGGVFWLLNVIFGFIRDSDVYKQSLADARANPAVVAALGEPIEEAGWPSGSIQYSGASGSADLRIPIKGPNGQAALYVVASRAMGTWTYTTQSVVLDATGEPIDLLAPSIEDAVEDAVEAAPALP